MFSSSVILAGLGNTPEVLNANNILFKPKLTRPVQQHNIKMKNDVLAHWFKARVDCEVTVDYLEEGLGEAVKNTIPSAWSTF